MRGFSPIVNIMFTCLAALAMVPVLGLPWFAAAVDSNNGNQGAVELMGEAIARWFTSAGTTTTGAEMLTRGETALLAVAALSALLALAMLVPQVRSSVRGLVKLVPFAAPAIVLVQVLAEASPAAVEPRWGAFAAVALSVFLASSAAQAGELRERKPIPTAYSPGANRAF